MKKKLALFLALCILGSSLSGCSSNGAASTPSASSPESGTASAAGGTVKIGIVTAITGSNSLVGEEAMNAAKLAVGEINAAGGVNGQNIELVPGDEVDNLEASVLATQKLLANKDIAGIVGSMYSTYCIAAMPSVKEASMPYISLGSSSGVSNEKNPYTWQDRPLDTAQGMVLADFVVNTLKCKNPAILYSTQSALSSEEEQVVKNLKEKGVTISDSNLFANPEDESNYASYLAQIKNGDFDCLISLENQAPSALVCQQAEAAGIDPSKFPCIGSTSFSSSVCLKNAGSSADNWYSVSDWVPGGSTKKAADFEAAYQKAYGVPSDLASACAYDGVYLFAEAMKLAKSNTDREAINKAMEKVNIEGAISKFTYHDDHSFATSLSITQNVSGQPKAIKAIQYRD